MTERKRKSEREIELMIGRYWMIDNEWERKIEIYRMNEREKERERHI